MRLSDIILENQDYRVEADQLEKELRDTYNRDDIYVTMGAYAGGRPENDPLRNKGYGKVTIRQREDLQPAEYKNMKNVLTAKGYEIVGGANWYEEEDDRYIYPDIKFHFEI